MNSLCSPDFSSPFFASSGGDGFSPCGVSVFILTPLHALLLLSLVLSTFVTEPNLRSLAMPSSRPGAEPHYAACPCRTVSSSKHLRRPASVWRRRLRILQMTLALSLACAFLASLLAHLIAPSLAFPASEAISMVPSHYWLRDASGFLVWSALLLATSFRRRLRFGHIHSRNNRTPDSERGSSSLAPSHRHVQSAPPSFSSSSSSPPRLRAGINDDSGDDDNDDSSSDNDDSAAFRPLLGRAALRPKKHSTFAEHLAAYRQRRTWRSFHKVSGISGNCLCPSPTPVRLVWLLLALAYAFQAGAAVYGLYYASSATSQTAWTEFQMSVALALAALAVLLLSACAALPYLAAARLRRGLEQAMAIKYMPTHVRGDLSGYLAAAAAAADDPKQAVVSSSAFASLPADVVSPPSRAYDDDGSEPDTTQSSGSDSDIGVDSAGAPPRRRKSHRAPEDKANLVSLLSFHWAQPLMVLGFKKALQMGDLLSLPRSLASRRIAVDFLESVRDALSNLLPAPASSDGDSFIRLSSASSSASTFSLFRVLNSCFGASYYPLGVLRFLSDGIAFSGPLLLNALVSFVQDTSEPLWHGYLYGGLLFLGTLASSLFGVQYNYLVNKVGLQVRAGLITSVYAKTLRLGSTASHGFTSGEIVNFMSTDTDRVVNFCPSFHQFWSLPVQVAVTLYLLYTQVGYAFVAGLAVAILLIPINRVLAEKIGTLSKDMMHSKDARVKLMNEILSGIRVVKFYAWEDALLQRIQSIRSREMDALRGRKYLDALCVYFWATTPVLISILTFLTFVLMNGADALTAAKVFTSLSLFNMLISPLNAFPWVLNGLMEAWVSVKRLERFLCAPEFARVDDVRVSSLDFIRPLHARDGDGADAAAHPLSLRSSRSSSVASADPFVVYMRDATFQWPVLSESPAAPTDAMGDAQHLFQLKGVNLAIRSGHLVGVFGSVGSGKSSLLAAILGEMPLVSGVLQLNLPSSTPVPAPASTAAAGAAIQGDAFAAPIPIAFAAQQPWIQNATVASNVVFGLPMERDVYERVLFACALLPDLRILPSGDQTEIGENGVTLSGGQKARISLARAVYQCAYTAANGQGSRLILLDDPLSAVDAHVAAHIMQHCVAGLLKSHTVILASHHVSHLVASCETLVCVSGSSVVSAQRGSQEWDSLVSHKSLSPVAESAAVAASHEASSRGKAKVLASESELDDASLLHAVSLADSAPSRLPAAATAKEPAPLQDPASASFGPEAPTADGALMTVEQRETGVVKARVHKSYWKSMGVGVTASVIVSLALMQGSRNANDWWLSYWVEQIGNSSTTPASLVSEGTSLGAWIASRAWQGTAVGLSNDTRGDSFYLGVYGGLAGANSLFTLVRAFMFAYGGLCAARVIHDKLLHRILHAPIAFFDSTPIGRIINRFSTDVYTVDDNLPFIMNIFLAQTFAIIGTIVITCYGLPWFALCLIPLSIAYYFIQRYYRRTSRELKRLDSISRSPLYAHFSETISGTSTIRAFAQESRFCSENIERLTANQKASYAGNVAGQWLGVRLQLLGVFIVAAVAAIAVLEHALGSSSTLSSLSPGLVGLSISYALSVTSLLSGVVTSFTETEKEMVSVERAFQYIEHVPQEDGEDEGNARLWSVAAEPPSASSWLQRGDITFDNVVLVYRPGLQPALSGISFKIAHGEKVGLVGRTGCGKSSCFLALFRMAPVIAGNITVGGRSIVEMPRKALRAALTIIPQDPVLFSGTVRENLDPLNEHSDDDVARAVEKCQLQSSLQDGTPAGEQQQRMTARRILDLPVLENGSNFSVGQRQLICLGRALLKRSKILCIDEATASVDAATDSAIQKSIRSEFRETTVLTIAHRIQTIMDYDRILVLDQGRVVEEGAPGVLLSNPKSLFSGYASGVSSI